jgi:7-cyano-7-deazaguanine synthase
MSGLGIAIVSGGMDSTTLLYMLRAQGEAVMALSFDYGQRHGGKELDAATDICRELHVHHTNVDLTSITDLLSASGSSLVTDTEVPEGHYEEDSMKQTVVPNRNAIMLNVAIGYAVAENAEYVAIGVHSGDHAVYPDCRDEFINAQSQVARIANEGFINRDFGIFAPFVTWTKTDIAARGKELNVPYEKTWSCYKGGSDHCGRCGTCVERIEALHDAGVDDQTVYLDPTFWRTATKRTK